MNVIGRPFTDERISACSKYPNSDPQLISTIPSGIAKLSHLTTLYVPPTNASARLFAHG